MADDMKDLKKLSPEERLAKLKDIEEKSRKEIAEAQKLIKQSEGEIEEKKKFEEKVPIPQLTVEGDEGILESSEEREMLEAQRGKRATLEEAKAQEKKSLEEQLRSEHIEELARKPAAELKEMMADIYQRAEAQGGQMNQEQRSDVYNIAKAEHEKIYAMQTGDYPTEQIGSALESISATFEMGKKLRQMYESDSSDSGPGYQRN